MNYADIKKVDIANGPGVRVSLFVSGCERHCPGCFNRETWDYEYGKPFGEAETDLILKLLCHSYIRGFSLLGGEPFAERNRDAVYQLLRTIRARYTRRQKDIWCYTGYLYEELQGTDAERILQFVDVLVDGPFVEEKKNLGLCFRGSSNQRIIAVPNLYSKNSEPIILEGE